MNRFVFVSAFLWSSFAFAQYAVIEVNQPEEGLVTLVASEKSEADTFSWASTAPLGTWLTVDDEKRVVKFGGAKPGTYMFFLVATRVAESKATSHLAVVQVKIGGYGPPIPVFDLEAKTQLVLRDADRIDLSFLAGSFTALRSMLVREDSPLNSEAKVFDTFEKAISASDWVRPGKPKNRYPEFNALLKATLGADTAAEAVISTKDMTPERRAAMAADLAKIISGIERLLNGK